MSDGFVVRPVPLTVTAAGASVTYGGPVPAITASYSGFVDGDTAASLTTPPTCSTTATTSSPVGQYVSRCSGAVDHSYTISYVSGKVAVQPAPLTITASSTSFTSGGVVPRITATGAGFVNGQGLSSLPGLKCSTTATSSSPPGTYPSSCSGAENPNYDISYVAGTVTVEAASSIAPIVGSGAPTTTVATSVPVTTSTITAATTSTTTPSSGTTTTTAQPTTTSTTSTTGQVSTTGPTSTTSTDPAAQGTTTTTAQPTTTSTASTTGTTSSPPVPGTSAALVATVTGLSPATGPTAGGTTVVIKGKWFEDVEKVRFGGHAARFKVVSDHELIARSPSGKGTVTVVVLTPAGTSAPGKRDQFSYLAAGRSSSG